MNINSSMEWQIQLDRQTINKTKAGMGKLELLKEAQKATTDFKPPLPLSFFFFSLATRPKILEMPENYELILNELWKSPAVLCLSVWSYDLPVLVSCVWLYSELIPSARLTFYILRD